MATAEQSSHLESYVANKNEDKEMRQNRSYKCSHALPKALSLKHCSI